MQGQLGLAGIDMAIVIAYLVGILFVGFWFSRRVHTATDFFLAGRTLPFWAVGMSIVVSDIGATDFIAVAGGTYKYGLAQANFDWLGSMPALLIAALVLIPHYWRSGVLSIPEFLGRRFGTEVRSFLAVAWGLILLMNLGIMIHATAVLLHGVLGWAPQVSVWVTTLVVGFYTISGGLAAVVMTDVVQLVIMFLGGTVLVVQAIRAIGSFDQLKEQVLAQGPAYADHFELYLPHDTASPFPWSGIVLGLGIVLSTSYYTGNQAMVQRALGARTEWDAKAGVLFAALLKLFIPVLVALPGLAAIVLVPGLENGDEAVPSLIRLLLPPGLRGILFAAFLAALMSSVDSNLNSASTLWTNDIIGKLRQRLGRSWTERERLRWGRSISAVLLLFGALIAPQIALRFSNIYNAIQTAFSLVQGPTLALLLLGVLWPRANRWGALAGLAGGVSFSLIMNTAVMAGVFPSEEPFLFVAWWSFVLSLLLIVAVSLSTAPPPDEQSLARLLRRGDGEVGS